MALWPLDDTADYLSLISESQRSVYTWQITNGSAEMYSEIINEPFPESNVTRLTGDGETPGSTEDILKTLACKSSGIYNFQELNQDLGTFCIGAYFYSESAYIDSIEIGYSYQDSEGEDVEVVKNFVTSVSGKWLFVSETFSIPEIDADFSIILRIKYLSSVTNQEPYYFFVNGVSLGQWSENFNSTSLGVSALTLPENIFNSTVFGIKANAYGFNDSDGYYLINNKSLVAQNRGVPMVYGSSNLTTLSKNNNNPSLILPAYGFMNETGKYKKYTYEMWIRINSDSLEAKRVFGPIRSDDGLYVEGPFLKLKIGDNIGSHYIGEWGRPMLIHIRMIENFASLLINGEQVLSLSYETSQLSFPDEYTEGKSNDWVGFYLYDDVSPIDIDAVAIYSYNVPSVVAKRRFVYGQGVEFPENINSSYSGTSVYVDYPFSDYTNNYSYPDIGSWSQGALDNTFVENNIISAPRYELPDLIFENINEEIFLNLNLTAQDEDDKFITFSSTESTINNGYILFPSLNMTLQDTKAFYGIFKAKELSSAQTLFLIENETTKEYFEIELDQSTVKYKYSGRTAPVYEAIGYEAGEMLTVGLHMENFASYYGADIAEFFGNKSQLKVYVGGNKEFSKTFTGNIYKIGFCNESNYDEISYLFTSYGVTIDYENVFDMYNETLLIEWNADNLYFGDGGSYYTDEGQFEPNLGIFWDYVINGGDPLSFAYEKSILHTASYTLIPKEYYNKLILDIAVKGSWQDYIPLSYFAQYVTDAKGNRYYDLDFLQFNIDYPAPSDFIQSEGGNEFYYNTENSMIKTDITFQYTETGANAPDSYFIKYVNASKDGIVEPGEDWINSKYEVVDNMIIYSPSGANFEDISIVTTLNFEIPGIISNPVRIKKLAYCSQAFNKDTSNPVGTRFGTPIYPYKKSGVYFDYKSRNPFSIYKSSSPYLYMTRYSGIQLRGSQDSMGSRGLSIPINQTKSDDYKVMAMQIAIKYDEDKFSSDAIQIFEVQSKDAFIKFYMQANHVDGNRAKIYAINANTGRLENGISFYLNGLLVRDPIITIKEWSFLGISFSSLLDFSEYSGALRVNGPIMINTISHYQSTNLLEVQRVSVRPWLRVKLAPPLTLDWQFWDAAYIWQQVLILSSTSYYGVDPSDIYKSYTGTNKIIVDDPRVFSINNYEYSVIKDVSWQSNTVNAL